MLDSGPQSAFPGTSRFELVGRLGEGAMGVVWEAIDHENGTRVALKALRRTDPESIYRLKNEFRALRGLRHDNLVSLGELVEEAGHWFFTMELLDGTDLLQHVRPDDAQFHRRESADREPARELVKATAVPAEDRRAPGFDDARLRQSLGQLALGLFTIHQADTLHRDVKPSNVRVTSDGRVVLLDFGFTVTPSQGHSKVGNDIVGTASYMAPEQARGQASAASDWYSVGVLLFEALTGQVPFDGPPMPVLLAKQSDTPARPSELVRDVPPDLDGLCAELMQLDPAARPTGAQVLERLQSAPQSQARASSVTLPPSAPDSEMFVGRVQELDALDQAFARSRQGRAVCALVMGESGVGKSALVRRFTRKLIEREPRLVLYTGRCYEREWVPYRAFDGVVDALSSSLRTLGESKLEALLDGLDVAALAQVFPVLRRLESIAKHAPPPADIDAQELRRRGFDAFRELLVRHGRRSALVIVIDDLQWVDADSVALLARLLEPPDSPQLLVLGTLRPADAESGAEAVLHRLFALPGEVLHFSLMRLPPKDAETLARELMSRFPDLPGDQAEQLAMEAGGHPLFIDELVRHFRARLKGQPLDLDEALWSRVRALDPDAYRLMSLACLASRPMAPSPLARAAGLAPNRATQVIDQLKQARLIRAAGAASGERLEPYHDRLRQSVVAHVGPSAGRGLHRELAVALEEGAGGEPEALAAHWDAAGEPARAAGYAERAARDAARALAFGRAVELYRMAIEFHGDDAAELATLLPALGEALTLSGRSGEAGRVFLRAADAQHARTDEDFARILDLRRRAAAQLLRAGFIDEGLDVVQSVLTSIGVGYPATPKRALLSLVVTRTRLKLRGLRFEPREESAVDPALLRLVDTCYDVGTGMAMCDTIRGADFQSRSLLHALRAGEPVRVVRSLALEACFASTQGVGKARRAEALIAEGVRVAGTTETRDHPLLLVAGGISSYFTGRFPAALRHCDEAVRNLQGMRDVTWETTSAKVFALWALYFLGHLDTLVKRQRAHLAEATERGDLYAMTQFRSGRPNLAYLVRDRVGEARAQANRAIEEWTQKGFHVAHFGALLAHVNAFLYEGDGPAALARFEESWQPLRSSLLLRVESSRVETFHMRGRVALGAARATSSADTRDRLLRVAEDDARRLTREKASWAHPLAKLLEAAVRTQLGQSPVGALEEAEQLLTEQSMDLLAVCARWRLSEATGDDPGRSAAETELRAMGATRPDRLVSVMTPGF